VSQYTVTLTRPAQKQLDKAPKGMRGRLQAAIGSLAREPRPVGCIKLSGHRNAWRIREGDWRIIYEVYDKHLEVIVVEVATRDEVYEGY
jgi:mRNA interferase RelE/StbE